MSEGKTNAMRSYNWNIPIYRKELLVRAEYLCVSAELKSMV